MKKIRPFLFVCMFVLLSLSLTACAGRKNGNMNGTEQNSATSSAASETGNGTGAGTGENGMNGDTASGWGEGENGTMTGGTNGEIETTGEGLLDDLTDDRTFALRNDRHIFDCFIFDIFKFVDRAAALEAECTDQRRIIFLCQDRYGKHAAFFHAFICIVVMIDADSDQCR